MPITNGNGIIPRGIIRRRIIRPSKGNCQTDSVTVIPNEQIMRIFYRGSAYQAVQQRIAAQSAQHQAF